MMTRRTFLARPAATAAAGGLAGLAGTGTAYGTAVEPHRVGLTRHAPRPRNWPAGMPLRIAVLTDFHAHPRNMGEADLHGVVERTNALAPDLVALLGDYCSQDRGPVPPETVAGILAGLRAPLGVHAVQGNHDWTDDRAALRRGAGPTRTETALRRAGIPLVENRAVRLAPGLWLAGLGSETQAGPDGRYPQGHAALDALRAGSLRRALEGVPDDAAVVLLAHEPDVFALDLDPRIALTLSGHTHGGQVRLFGWSPWIPSRYGNRYALGHVVEGDRHLVVSAGLGAHFVLGRPLRIGVPPEIVLVEASSPAA